MTPDNLVAFISPREPWGHVVESRSDRAAQAAVVAIDDLNLAIVLAEDRSDLQMLRKLAETLIQTLEASACTALTFDEHFDDMRRARR